MDSKHLVVLNQLYHEYKVLLGEKKDDPSREQVSNQFKQKFLAKFADLEPTDMIRLCYQYFSGLLSASSQTEKTLFFDYNLLMFDVISSKLVRKPRILDVWFSPSEENKKRLIKAFTQAQREILFYFIPFSDKDIAQTVINLTAKNNIAMNAIVEECQNNSIFVNLVKERMEIRYAKESCNESYIIIDKRIVINGFLKWDDQENMTKHMTLLENESLARAFCENFAKYWQKLEVINKNIEKNNKKHDESFINNKDKKKSLPKKYSRMTLSKLKKIRRKMRKLQKKNKRNSKRNGLSKKKIEKPKKGGGMIHGLFGFVRKIFR